MSLRKGIFLSASLLLLAVASSAAEGEGDVPRLPLSDSSLDLPLLVTETEGLARRHEVLRSGVPLPESAAVRHATRLYLLAPDESGQFVHEVPLQAVVTSRWGGLPEEASRPAKWVRLTFPVSVARSGRANYRLRYAPDGTWERPDGEQVETWQRRQITRSEGTVVRRTGLVSDAGDRFEVDTGRLRFSVSKEGFGLFRDLRTKAQEESRPEWIPMAGEEPFDVHLVDAEGTSFRASAGRPDLIEVEEDGPLFAVFRIEGPLVDGQGRLLLEGWAAYSIRVHVHAGSPFVRLYFTLENDGFYGLDADWSVTNNTPKWLYFRSLELTFTGVLEGDRKIRVDGIREPLEVNGETGFRLLQQHEIRQIPETVGDESQNFFYSVRTWDEGGEREVYSGDRSLGVVQTSNSLREYRFGVRYFWQNEPTALSLSQDLFKIELWPEEGYWPETPAGRRAGTYQFEGGRHKTFEIALDFRPGNDRDPLSFSKRLKAPLSARAPAEWYASTRALTHLAPYRFPIGNDAIAVALKRFNQMHEAYVDVSRAEPQPKDRGDQEPMIPPISLVTQRETRGNAFPVMKYDVDLYGWFNFGDLPWSQGFCAVHHDWPLGLLLQYLRREDGRRFLDIAEEMTRHRYDIAQYHCRERSHDNWFWFNGFQRYDRGWHGDLEREGGYRSEQPPRPGHTWLAGLLLHHALTGDPRSLAAARENADAFYHWYVLGKNVFGGPVRLREEYEIRSAAMALTGLWEFYLYTGEGKYRRAALAILENHILFTEELEGMSGYLGPEDSREVLNVLYLLEPLRKIHATTGDSRILALMLRMLSRLTEIYEADSGVARLSRYKPLQLPERYTPGHWEATQVPYGYLTADAYAYAWLATGQPSLLRMARRLFHDSVLYFQAGAGQLVPPSFSAAVSYNPWKYPGKETMVNAWVLRGHQVYLFAEWLLSLSGAPEFRFPNDEFRLQGGASRIESGRDAEEETEDGSEGGSPDFEPPKIEVTEVTQVDDLVTIHVRSNEPTFVEVEYGTDVEDTEFTTRTDVSRSVHAIRLPGLDKNRSWYFRVWARDLAQNATSTEFRPLRTGKDRSPPRIARVAAPESKKVVVTFSEPVRSREATRKENWRIDPEVLIRNAELDASGRVVTLVTSPLEEGKAYHLRVGEVRDRSEPANPMAGPGVTEDRTFYRDVLADDSDPVFTILNGDWGQTTTELSAWRGTTRFASSGEGSARAEWRIPVPVQGYYEVYAWWPKSKIDRQVATRVPYRIRYLGGVNTALRDQRVLAGEWVLLATVPFSEEAGAVIGLSTEGANGTVLADAIRLVYVPEP